MSHLLPFPSNLIDLVEDFLHLSKHSIQKHMIDNVLPGLSFNCDNYKAQKAVHTSSLFNAAYSRSLCRDCGVLLQVHFCNMPKSKLFEKKVMGDISSGGELDIEPIFFTGKDGDSAFCRNCIVDRILDNRSTEHLVSYGVSSRDPSGNKKLTEFLITPVNNLHEFVAKHFRVPTWYKRCKKRKIHEL